MKKLSSLSIFFPAFNDEKSIAKLVNQAHLTGGIVTDSLQVTVVNDGSKDRTLEVLKNLRTKYPDLNIVNHQKNRGYGGALKSGFKVSKNDWIFYTDGDGQYDVRELTKMVKLVKNRVDVVNGTRKVRSDLWFRVFLGNLYNFLTHLVYNAPVSDVDSDFRLIKKSKLKKIKLNSDSGLICLELILKLKKNGAVFAETEVSHLPRLYGKSQFFSIKHLTSTLVEHLKFWIEYRKES